jgi:hypothetical protein
VVLEVDVALVLPPPVPLMAEPSTTTLAPQARGPTANRTAKSAHALRELGPNPIQSAALNSSAVLIAGSSVPDAEEDARLALFGVGFQGALM